MPIYAYACRACGESFQTLVRSNETPECPTCKSADLERRLSLIASPSKGGEDAGAGQSLEEHHFQGWVSASAR